MLAILDQPEADLLATLQELRIYLNVFLGLQLTAFIGAILTLISSYFSKVKRLRTWYNLLRSLIFFSTSFLLLFFTGTMWNPHPSYTFCMIQSTVIQSCSPFVGACALGLVIELYLVTRSALLGKQTRYMGLWIRFATWFPHVVLVGVSIEALAIALPDPNLKFSAISTCSWDKSIPGHVSSAIFIILMIPGIILLGLTFKSIQTHSYDAHRPVKQYRGIFIRLCLTMLVTLISIIVGAQSFLNHSTFTLGNSRTSTAQLNIVLGAMASLTMLIFATQKDLLEFWLFWRWFKRGRNSPGPTRSQNTSSSTTSSRIELIRHSAIDEEFERLRNHKVSPPGSQGVIVIGPERRADLEKGIN